MTDQSQHMFNKSNDHYATLSIHPHGHKQNDPVTGAVVTPISLATTFEQPAPGQTLKGFEYARSDNPTRKILEETVSKLEHGTFGLAFSSGSAALACIVQLCPPDSHILCVDDVYGGTRRFLTKCVQTQHVEFINLEVKGTEDLCLKRVKANTSLIWLETPSNPTLRLVNIAKVAKAVKRMRESSKDPHWPLLVVDNTFLSSIFQQPLLLGADLVVHSVSKYLNGHSDVIMGVIIGNRDDGLDLDVRLKFLQNALGPVPSPFDCYLVLRGLKTLYLRMQQHQKNAMAVATILESHPRVERVYYSGLASHPQHQLACSQQSGHGGIVSFSLRNASINEATRFCQNTRIFTLAESLGCVESLCEIPAVMTHASVDAKARRELGITDAFIRLSVGIEGTDDLVNDLKQALEKAFE